MTEATSHTGSESGRPSAAAPRGVAKRIASVFVGLVGVILLTSLAITIYTIISRNAGYSTDDWVLKLPESMLGWMTFLGMGALVAEGGHVAADMFIALASRRFQRVAYTGWTLITAGVLALILAGSLSIVVQTYDIGETNFEIFDLPQWIILLPLPAGLGITILHLLAEAVSVWRRDGISP
jgi:TRAP-type C4-dicarboxylate transport system permease small subunit